MAFVLKCSQNDDGSVDGHIEEDGIVNPRYVVRNGDCSDIEELGRRANTDFGLPVDIDPTCQALCFGPGKIEP